MTVHDVLVIGAGAAGGAVMKRLAARGVDVLCLEAGDWVPAEARPKAHLDWETRLRRYWNPSPSKRNWPGDYPVEGHGRNPIDAYLYAAVGGSTVGYGGHFWRLNPTDFRAKTLDDFGVDWPIAYEDLAPYYTLNEYEIGTSGLGGDPTEPPRERPLPTGPLPIGKLGD